MGEAIPDLLKSLIKRTNGEGSEDRDVLLPLMTDSRVARTRTAKETLLAALQQAKADLDSVRM